MDKNEERKLCLCYSVGKRGKKKKGEKKGGEYRMNECPTKPSEA